MKKTNKFKKEWKLIFTCKLSWTRSASLLAKADSKMLECSRRVLWDCAKPANFPFSCSSSSANFLLASSNFLIRFLKHRDSWSCEKYNLVYLNWTTAAQKCHKMIGDYVLLYKGDSPVQKPELSGTNLHVHLIFELQDLLLVLLQLCGGQGDHLLQLLLQHRLAVGHNLQLSLKGLYLLLGDK